MSSHVYLVMQVGADPISMLTRKVQLLFWNWVNKQRGGFGSILAERPKSILVRRETYGMVQAKLERVDKLRPTLLFDPSV
jgi:hypothetical protein